MKLFHRNALPSGLGGLSIHFHGSASQKFQPRPLQHEALYR